MVSGSQRRFEFGRNGMAAAAVGNKIYAFGAFSVAEPRLFLPLLVQIQA